MTIACLWRAASESCYTSLDCQKLLALRLGSSVINVETDVDTRGSPLQRASVTECRCRALGRPDLTLSEFVLVRDLMESSWIQRQ